MTCPRRRRSRTILFLSQPKFEEAKPFPGVRRFFTDTPIPRSKTHAAAKLGRNSQTDSLPHNGKPWCLPLPAFAGVPILNSHMKACLDVETLVASATPQLKEIAEVGASFLDPNTDEACAAFARQVSMLEGTVKQTFRAATLLARKSGELEEIAEIWKNLSGYCGSVLTTLAALREKYPFCSTTEVYDLALQYKEACEDRLRDVEEEIKCQKMDLPKGLLPELN